VTREEMVAFIQTADTYTEILFSAYGSNEVNGIIRDLPVKPSGLRRVTVTTTGTEFFVGPDTEMESLRIVG
jgi:hypothetical protein